MAAALLMAWLHLTASDSYISEPKPAQGKARLPAPFFQAAAQLPAPNRTHQMSSNTKKTLYNLINSKLLSSYIHSNTPVTP